MSSLFTVAEIEVARLALAELYGEGLDVVVGGLGLGYTAQTVLQDPNVASLLVVETLGEVIDWHERGLIPVGATLTLMHDAGWSTGLLRHGRGFRARPQAPGGASTPSSSTSTTHRATCCIQPCRVLRARGLRRLADHLARWSLLTVVQRRRTLRTGGARGRVRAGVGGGRQLPQPLQDRDATNTVYIAR
jgi:hypothetical protein